MIKFKKILIDKRFLFGCGVILPYMGWKVTEATIMESWLNITGLWIIYTGLILSHFDGIERLWNRLRNKLKGGVVG